ncbi:MAG TPA: single-stranded DNA-binding protein [Allocoleopsis sp.]
MSLNVVTLVGRVGGDPDVKFFESGSVVCNLTLAVDRRTRNNDQPDWFNLELWGKTAQVAADYVRKGSLIGVSGALKFESWQDRNTGATRSKPVIRVDRLELLGSKRDNDAGSVGNYSNNYSDDEF